MTKTTESTAPRVTKTAKLLALLQTGTGASLEDMTDLTDWQPHTVRAALTGLKKKGHVINKHVEGNTTIWSVKVPAA
jgi:DNA-binding IclR family transcriptional regulator